MDEGTFLGVQWLMVAGPPFACKLCGTLFNLKQSWYVHMRREACKKFPDKYGLNSNKFSPKVILQEDSSNSFLQFGGSDDDKTV